MKKPIGILLMMTILLFSMMSCGKDSNDSIEPQKAEMQKEKFDIVSVWTDVSGNNENFISFAKDGTYKMIMKQVGGSDYFISTGRYSNTNLTVNCTDNCVESSSKTYNFITQNGELVLNGMAFKRSGVEDNALENKLSGLNIKFGGHSISEHFKIIGQCSYYLNFTNDYRAYKILEYVYKDGKSQNKTKTTLCHYIFYDNFLYLAEDGDSYGKRYIYEPEEFNCFYYKDENGQIRLP